MSMDLELDFSEADDDEEFNVVSFVTRHVMEHPEVYIELIKDQIFKVGSEKNERTRIRRTDGGIILLLHGV